MICGFYIYHKFVDFILSLMQRQSLITQEQHLESTQQVAPLINNNIQTEGNKQEKKKQRLDSLDVHRGLTMFGMVVVDCCGPQPLWWTNHVDWNGLSPADLVFPSFVFIMGMAVPLAVNNKKPVSLRTIIRIFALILIGVVLQFIRSKFNINEFRILGILQRIGVCYGVTILTHYLTDYGNKSFRMYGLLLTMIYGVTYIGYMASFENIQINCPKQQNLTKWCNFGAYIDRAIFGQHHMIYPNDPQGIFTNLNAIVTAYIGYYFSLIMFDNKNKTFRMLLDWVIISLSLLLMSYPLSLIMPYNKKIWSSSYTLGSAGIIGLVICSMILLVDIAPKKSPKARQVIQKIIRPFIWLGRNPLAIFVLMDLLNSLTMNIIQIDDKSLFLWIYYNVFESWITIPELASIVNSLLYGIFWTCIAGLFFKFNFFVRL